MIQSDAIYAMVRMSYGGGGFEGSIGEEVTWRFESDKRFDLIWVLLKERVSVGVMVIPFNFILNHDDAD